MQTIISTDTPRKLESYMHEKLRVRINGKQRRVHSEWFWIDSSWLNVVLTEARLGVRVPFDVNINEIVYNRLTDKINCI